LPVTFETLELILWDANVFTSHKPIGSLALSKEVLRSSKKDSDWFSLTAASPDESWVSGSIRLHTKAQIDGGVAYLNLTVESGHDLASKDSNGLSDPYVSISLLPDARYSVQKTQVKKKTLNPV
jgi:Ca2+-dependent lipid-binding protein